MYREDWEATRRCESVLGKELYKREKLRRVTLAEFCESNPFAIPLLVMILIPIVMGVLMILMFVLK